MPAFKNTIQVAVALPVAHPYTYAVPESMDSLATVGKRVLVPFGKRRVTGYILGPDRDDGAHAPKAILDVLDDAPLFPPEMIPFFRWVADYYMHPIGGVIRSALPGGLTTVDVAELTLTADGQTALADATLTPLERDVLNALRDRHVTLASLKRRLGQEVPQALTRNLMGRKWIASRHSLQAGKTRARLRKYVRLASGHTPAAGLTPAGKRVVATLETQPEMSLKALKAIVPSAGRLLKPLSNAGVVRIVEKPLYRDPFGEAIVADQALTLTAEQAPVVSALTAALGKGYATYLLSGVTGSGKTEVYLQTAAAAVEMGSTVIVLVPEIALISQTERRFRARFGERIAVLHSALTPGERYDQWVRIAAGHVPIVIGARSAVFAPLNSLGLIIVDEEHDASYKQESGLRYNARDLAVVRALENRCVALLGSATPSVQSCHNARQGKFLPLSLRRRVHDRPLPKIDVVDLRRHRDRWGRRQFITRPLQRAMATALGAGQQVLLFLNRRGFANLPLCGSCGTPIRCKNCDITLTLHQGSKAYKCHYCGFQRPTLSRCPHCGAPRIDHLGIGTEQVEQMVQTLFPQAAVARMDRDTTMRKGSLVKLLKDLCQRRIDVMVGTQMVTKGHDFPGITLVGIIMADLSLNFPDFRAGERTFQLLAQVAGRAGRGDAPGRVILQTFNPDHFCIQAAREQDVDRFYRHEITFRQTLHYPPFTRMVLLRIQGVDKAAVQDHAKRIGAACRGLATTTPEFAQGLTVLGPIEAAIARVANRYRWQILLKAAHARMLQHFIGRLRTENPKLLAFRGVRVTVDVDPLMMM